MARQDDDEFEFKIKLLCYIDVFFIENTKFDFGLNSINNDHLVNKIKIKLLHYMVPMKSE